MLLATANGAKIKGCKFTRITIFYSSFSYHFSSIKSSPFLYSTPNANMNYLTEGGILSYNAPHALEDGIRRDDGDGGGDTLVHSVFRNIYFIPFCQALRTFNTLRC